MAIVSPSILSADFGKLGADCRTVLDAGAQMLHYDVMDGHFVPNISFGVPVLKSLHKTLPDAFYDVHLMISHPLQYAEPFIKAGATLYNFHLECEDDIQQTLDAVKAQGCTGQAALAEGGAREARPALSAGSGRRRGRHHRPAVRGGRCRRSGGRQCRVRQGRQDRRRAPSGCPVRGSVVWMKH